MREELAPETSCIWNVSQTVNGVHCGSGVAHYILILKILEVLEIGGTATRFELSLSVLWFVSRVDL
jgi:hypothetical protein